MSLFVQPFARSMATDRPAEQGDIAVKVPILRPNVVSVTTALAATIPAAAAGGDTTVDLLVVGSGTGMAAALAAHELGLSVLIVEKSSYVGGSTARSGGALWLPASPVLAEKRCRRHRGSVRDTYLDSVVAGTRAGRTIAALSAQRVRDGRHAAAHHTDAVSWAKDYSDYHPEEPGGSAGGPHLRVPAVDTAILGSTAPGCGPVSWRPTSRCRPPAPTTAG